MTTNKRTIRQKSATLESAITPHSTYLKRRDFLRHSINSLAATGIALSSLPVLAKNNTSHTRTYDLDEKLNSFEEITQYNNFYELGTDKLDPYKNAHHLNTHKWQVSIEGECDKPGTYTLEDILKPHSLEERVYRLRCVEAWSMVIPWLGFPLADLLKRFQPNSKAKYVAFETLYDEKNPLPGQKRRSIHWPYREGLTIDEAMNPLSFIATGLYGKNLPNQNGAPLRLVVPWKYGFKSIKSIVKIRFSETQPETSWNTLAPKEYGFYSNVNPSVTHPRWSQKRERRIGELFKRETLMLNGYADEVAHLYKGMNLKKYY